MSPLSTDVSSSQNITIRYHFEVTFYRGASDGLWSTGSLMFTLINCSLNTKVSILQLEIIGHFQMSTHNPPWSLQGTRSCHGPKFLNHFWQQHSMGERMSFRVRMCTCPGFTAPPAKGGGRPTSILFPWLHPWIQEHTAVSFGKVSILRFLSAPPGLPELQKQLFLIEFRLFWWVIVHEF